MAYTRQLRNGATIPGDWWDSAYEKRIRISVTNSNASDLHDHLVTFTVPNGTTVDPGSMRVVEHTTLGGVDKAYDWRYGTSNPGSNRLFPLPASINGQVVTFKALGRWVSGEVRRFNIYWSAVNGQSALNFNHLEPVAQGWTALMTAGTAGDTYAVVVGGTTYSYVMIGGDTATIIATAIKNAINAGTIATATSSTGTVTVSTKTPRSVFAVTNVGSTVPANVVVTKPIWFTVARTGPDTDQFAISALQQLGLPSTNLGTISLATVGIGQASASRYLKQFRYHVNGDTNIYGPIDATQTVTVNGPNLVVTGNYTFGTRSVSPDWSGTYTATYQHRYATLGKSDGTNATGVVKHIDMVRVQATYTALKAQTPNTVAVGNNNSGYILLDLAAGGNFSGNTTTLVGSQLTQWYCPVGSTTATAFTSNQDLSAQTVVGSVFGESGNTYSIGYTVNNVTLSGFTGQPSAQAQVFINGTNPTIQITGTTNGATIPIGASITVDFWFAQGITTNPTTIGDNVIPNEMIGILQSAAYTPTTSYLATETFTASTLYQTMLLGSNRAVDGTKWFQSNASLTGVATNSAFQYQAQTAAVTTPDDDDGNYGEGHKLHGLSLRYLRTHDPALIPIIEAQVQFHINIEAAAVSQYGSWWSGSACYWYWPKSTASGSVYTTEGGCSEFSGNTALLDPGSPTYPTLGTISYTQGQVRRKTSIDQSHMIGHGLYAYLYLLRNETGITANTTLQTNALSLLSRMSTFEAAKYASSACVLANLYAVCTGGTPTNGNGITAGFYNPAIPQTLANPYHGDNYPGWEESNTDNVIVNSSANSAIDSFFRSVWSSNGDNATTSSFLFGRVIDFLTADLGYHKVTIAAALTSSGFGVLGTYPHGWNMRVGATGNNTRYSAGLTGDKHYIEIGSGGSRDHLCGRACQRMVALALGALLNPNLIIPVETDGSGNVVRSTPILTALDDLARNISLYLPEPKTHGMRLASSGFLGKGSYDPQAVDSDYTGCWMMAVELWFLVQKRIAGSFSPSTYYKFAGVNAGTASALSVGNTPQTPVHATAFAVQPVIYAIDSSGYLDRTFNGNVTIAIKAGTGTGGAVLGGTLTVAAVRGVATFGGLSIDTAGAGYQLHATASGLAAVDTIAFTVS